MTREFTVSAGLYTLSITCLLTLSLLLIMSYFTFNETYINIDLLFCIMNFPGKNPTDDYLEQMMNEAPGPINFTMFLTMFGEKLNGTDPEEVIKNAFACFDEDNSGESVCRCP